MKGQALRLLLENTTGVHGVPGPGYQELLEQVSFWTGSTPGTPGIRIGPHQQGLGQEGRHWVGSGRFGDAKAEGSEGRTGGERDARGDSAGSSGAAEGGWGVRRAVRPRGQRGPGREGVGRREAGRRARGGRGSTGRGAGREPGGGRQPSAPAGRAARQLPGVGGAERRRRGEGTGGGRRGSGRGGAGPLVSAAPRLSPPGEEERGQPPPPPPS